MNQKLLALFGLKWNPFTPDIPVESLWRHHNLDHFCWRMETLVHEGGFALISGDPGTGKSVALRSLAHHLELPFDLSLDRPGAHPMFLVIRRKPRSVTIASTPRSCEAWGTDSTSCHSKPSPKSRGASVPGGKVAS